jgi:hypothetical protein
MKYIDKQIIFALCLLSMTAGVAVYAATAGWSVSLQVTSPVAATVRWAVPEGRIGASSTNWDSTFYLAVRPASDSDKSVIFIMDTLVSTTVAGEYATPITLTGVANSSTYDIAFKSHQHISSKLNDVFLEAGSNVLNFTQADNSIFMGPLRLRAGDINGTGDSPGTLGDNVVNSVDLSILLNQIDFDDPTTRGIRANFNQDVVINSVDLSMLIENLDLEGDI